MDFKKKHSKERSELKIKFSIVRFINIAIVCYMVPRIKGFNKRDAQISTFKYSKTAATWTISISKKECTRVTIPVDHEKDFSRNKNLFDTVLRKVSGWDWEIDLWQERA